ncbi:DUF1630-domain-containing protein [Leucogyrophana mollusca]|uniref:DUF1630-domain-containing protein n=1 Tax=Leucogyrophana mollusca TaxID=85980 RepID=A0ACB8BT96_9AGAM|nr:DUF1630-domain-containing protein [Leucogyrophana mollusca]
MAGEILEEEDIGLAYYSRSGSFTGSDTESLASRLPSRQPSQAQLQIPSSIGSSSQRDSSSAFKSPSLSNVFDHQLSTKHPATPRAVSRSKTLPHLTQCSRIADADSGHFNFEPEKLLRMRKWILAFVIVNFDLDVGPVVQGLHPPLWLSQEEKENIAFSSFPDSLQFEQGSEIHSFRIRDLELSPGASALDQAEERPRSDHGYMYGFSHFSQRKDASSKRGYQQSSIVILTHLPYPALFTSLASKLGPLFHRHGVPMLETACHNVASWCSPLEGSTIELGFLGSVLHVELPRTLDDQQLTETVSFGEKFDPSCHLLASSTPFDPPPVLLFETSLSHIWSIWECLVLGEPLLVYGPSPAMTSQAIWFLRDLLRPIPLAIDFRPYFTIHDKDHALLVNKLPPKGGLIIGVTNPFFEKSCGHWPHVLSLGGKEHSRRVATAAGPHPGWRTKTHKRYISKDRPLLKRIEMACSGNERDGLQGSLDLRSHFCSRTNALLAPLNRYLNTLIPSPVECTTLSSGPRRLRSFSSVNFLSSLKANGSPLPFRSTSKQKEFYERWLKTPAFGLWLAEQEAVVHKMLEEKGAV